MMAISIRLPAELEARLARLASKTGRTKSFYIKEAIAEQLADLEDYYLAEQRMRNYDSADNASLAEMMERHGVAR
jgi:RHH-type rel operon transcriptional repressor/antitoxin RelB